MKPTPIARTMMIVSLMSVSFGTAQAASLKMTDFKSEWVNCAKADVFMIFGKSVDACVITNLNHPADTKLEVKICTGVKVATGVKALIGGASLEAGSMLCFTATFETDDHTPGVDEIIKDPKLIEQIKKQIPGAIAKLPGGILQKLGVDKDRLNQITFEGPVNIVDKSGDPKVRDAANALKGTG